MVGAKKKQQSLDSGSNPDRGLFFAKKNVVKKKMRNRRVRYSRANEGIVKTAKLSGPQEKLIAKFFGNNSIPREIRSTFGNLAPVIQRNFLERALNSSEPIKQLINSTDKINQRKKK